MANRIDVAGLKIDPLTKRELFEELHQRVDRGQQTFITTPYSEFLYNGLRNPQVMDMLNKADIAFADGVGVVWADYFLSRRLTLPTKLGKILQSWIQVVYTGAQILLQPKKVYHRIPEKIVGADFVWDLAGFAEQNNLSVFLLGGYGKTPERTAELLKGRFPALRIAGTFNGKPTDAGVIDVVRSSSADVLLVAFGPLTQERWIVENFSNLPAKIAIGLGGTFDYLVGDKTPPPKFIRQAGLEWFYRLLTQPTRIKRIYEAFWGLIRELVRYKIAHNQLKNHV